MATTVNGVIRNFAEEAITEPQFDFSNTSYRNGRRMSRLQMEVELMQRRINEAPAEQGMPLLDELDRLLDEMEDAIMQAVVAVPRDWLVTDAPDLIQWGTKDALQWLRSNKFQALMAALMEAQRKGN